MQAFKEGAARGLHAGAASARAAEPPSAAAAAAATAPPPPPPPNTGLAGVPALVRALGFAGALPFWAFTPAAADFLPLELVDPSLPDRAGVLQVGYGATIISFLGGVHWGLAMTNVGGAAAARSRFAWSVVPSLMAFPTVALPTPHAAGAQAALLGIVYIADKGFAAKGLLPGWYMAMRLPLTLLAAGALVVTAVTGEDAAAAGRQRAAETGAAPLRAAPP